MVEFINQTDAGDGLGGGEKGSASYISQPSCAGNAREIQLCKRCESECWKKEKGIHIIGIFQCGYMYSVHKTSACCERTNPTWRPRHLELQSPYRSSSSEARTVPNSPGKHQGCIDKAGGKPLQPVVPNDHFYKKSRKYQSQAVYFGFS